MNVAPIHRAARRAALARRPPVPPPQACTSLPSPGIPLQGHNGPPFMTFHRAFLLELENSMLAVAPGLGALPYVRCLLCCSFHHEYFRGAWAGWGAAAAWPACQRAGAQAGAAQPSCARRPRIVTQVPCLPAPLPPPSGTSCWTTRGPSTLAPPTPSSGGGRVGEGSAFCECMRWRAPRPATCTRQPRGERSAQHGGAKWSVAPADGPPAASPPPPRMRSEKYAGRNDGNAAVGYGVTTGACDCCRWRAPPPGAWARGGAGQPRQFPKLASPSWPPLLSPRAGVVFLAPHSCMHAFNAACRPPVLP